MSVTEKFFFALPFIVFGMALYCAWVQKFTDKIFKQKDE